MENEILNLLLETLKIQAEKYKIIVNDDSLTHEQRKEFDTEITQMYNVLANLSNSSTIYTLVELKGLKAQYDVKFAEFDEKVANLDLSHLLVSFDSLTQEQKDSLKGQDGLNGNDGVDGQNGLSAFEIAVNNGFEGTEPEWLESVKGQNGLNGNDGVDGQNGLSAYDIAVNNGFEGTESQWLQSLNGQDGTDGNDGQSFTYDMFTPEQLQALKGEKGEDGLITVDSMTEQQKQEIANFVIVPSTSNNIFISSDFNIKKYLAVMLNITKLEELSIFNYGISFSSNTSIASVAHQYLYHSYKASDGVFKSIYNNTYMLPPTFSSEGYLILNFQSQYKFLFCLDFLFLSNFDKKVEILDTSYFNNEIDRPKW